MTSPAAPAPYEVYTQLLAHELRTPVTVIAGYLQLLQDERLLDDRELLREYLAVVQGRTADLARIVTELTTFDALIAGRAPPVSAPTTVPELVAALVGTQPVQVEIGPAAAAAIVDMERLGLVLRVLLDNAIAFGTPGSPALLRAALDDDPPRLVVRVTNAGPVIPEALREVIFGPFQQLEPHMTRRHGGLGLGLTVARRAAEGAGGSLLLEPDAPTTFRLELPLRQDPVAMRARELAQRAALADAQVLRTVQDLRALHDSLRLERAARHQAEQQQLRAVQDFRNRHELVIELEGRLANLAFVTVTSLARAIEARDGYTGEHVERVRAASVQLGSTLGLRGDTLRALEFGAILHDVGKIALPDAVLRKAGPLDAAEWRELRRHPELGRQLLADIAFLEPALDAVTYHHERWDGTGYPRKLAGEAIPLAGRIVAVADAYDAMVTDRPYRPAMPPESARGEIENGSGTQFDPVVAAAFLR